ncbi:hypothetical protein [Candidatus Palauibacter sp.]|uniref:hypothetical protein n=1 Tax=Candidatus Palauibacter sp. TaxID=3101350 RepID=UPI003CC63E04
MRKRIRGGLLIAVDVVPPVDLDVHAGGWQNWSGWRLALGRLNPFGKSGDPPGIVSILQRAGQLPSLQTRRARIEAEIADLYLKPPVQQFRILDFDVVEEAAEIGYSYGKAELERWSDSREPVTTVAS